MGREIHLIEVLPQFVQDYREIKQIMTAENPELQVTVDEIDVFRDNQFILTCNEKGIGRFEKLLHISPNRDDTLEARVSRVLARWNDAIPYTYRGLIEKLDSLCGIGNYQVLPSFNEYAIEIITSLTLSGQVDELEYMLSYMIPANISVISTNSLSCESSAIVFLGSVDVQTSFFTTSTELKTMYEAIAHLKYASISNNAATYQISGDFQKTIEAVATANFGGTNSMTVVFEIKN